MKIVAAHLLINLAIVGWPLYSNQLAPPFWFPAVNGVWIGQMMLLSFWLVFAKSQIWQKLMGTFIGFPFIFLPMQIGVSYSIPSEVNIVAGLRNYFAFGGGMAALLVFFRLFVLRPTDVSETRKDVPTFQFSTRTLLMVMTTVAVVFVIIRSAKLLGTQIPNYATIVHIGVGCMTIMCLSWGALGVGPAVLRWFSGFTVALILSSLPPIILDLDSMWYFWSGMIVSEFIIVVGTLMAVRAGGMRLVLVDSWLTRAVFVKKQAVDLSVEQD